MSNRWMKLDFDTLSSLPYMAWPMASLRMIPIASSSFGSGHGTSSVSQMYFTASRWTSIKVSYFTTYFLTPPGTYSRKSPRCSALGALHARSQGMLVHFREALEKGSEWHNDNGLVYYYEMDDYAADEVERHFYSEQGTAVE